MSSNLEREIAKYSCKLTEFMNRDEVLKIEHDSLQVIEREYELQKKELTISEKTLNEFLELYKEYHLEQLKKTYEIVLERARKNKKAVFYIYKPLTAKQLQTRAAMRLQKEEK